MRRRVGWRRGALIAALSSVAFLTTSVPASAAGQLTPKGCIEDRGSTADACRQFTEGLEAPRDVATSPDGRSVYAISTNESAIVTFQRNLDTGVLTAMGCIADATSAADCGTTIAGMQTPFNLTVSPDGGWVYVTAFSSNTITRFKRRSDGSLIHRGCVADSAIGGPCATTATGLRGTYNVAVSPDSRSVYATGAYDDAVVRFRRGTDGVLIPSGCVSDNDTGDAGCGRRTDGLRFPTGIAVSRDGTSAYATGSDDSAVVRFGRDTSGALTPRGCVEDVDTGADTCARTTEGLSDAHDVIASSDNASVYVASPTDNAVARFDRDAAGTLTAAGCFADNDEGPACADESDGLGGAFNLAITSDGISLYATGHIDHAIVRFDRSSAPATRGALTARGCIDDVTSGAETCARTSIGLGEPLGLAVTRDGTSVYAAAAIDNAVTRFKRSL